MKIVLKIIIYRLKVAIQDLKIFLKFSIAVIVKWKKFLLWI